MTIQETSTGKLIQEYKKIEKYQLEILKELLKRYDNECNSAKRYIEKLKKKEPIWK